VVGCRGLSSPRRASTTRMMGLEGFPPGFPLTRCNNRWAGSCSPTVDRQAQGNALSDLADRLGKALRPTGFERLVGGWAAAPGNCQIDPDLRRTRLDSSAKPARQCGATTRDMRLTSAGPVRVGQLPTLRTLNPVTPERQGPPNQLRLKCGGSQTNHCHSVR
jgi:hypothetical protein